MDCANCKCSFESRDKRRKFCSLKCYRVHQSKFPNSGTFKAGIKPWNEGTRGVMKRNSGSFQKGMKSRFKLELGDVSVRRDKSGKMRAWIKVADNGNSYDWILRAVYVWQLANGKVPHGCVIHHKDRDSLNDEISNLQCMTRAEHIEEHRAEIAAKRLSQEVLF